jgi:hypothetical protein
VARLLSEVRAGSSGTGTGSSGGAGSGAGTGVDPDADDEDLHEVVPVELKVRQSTAPPRG